MGLVGFGGVGLGLGWVELSLVEFGGVGLGLVGFGWVGFGFGLVGFGFGLVGLSLGLVMPFVWWWFGCFEHGRICPDNFTLVLLFMFV